MGEIGRPTIFTEELASKICKLRASGQSLRAICRLKDMPDRSTVRVWLLEETKKDFSDQYAQACEIDADNEFDDLIELADECNDPVDVQKYRLKIDIRKWVLSKRLPKKYGDIKSIELTGKDGGAIEGSVKIETITRVIRRPTKEE